MTEEIVEFKGSKDGLHLIVNKEYRLKDVKEKIQGKISSAQSFFKGIKKIKYEGTSLSQQDLSELIKWMNENFEIEIDIKKNVERKDKEEMIHSKVKKIFTHPPIEEGMTKYIYSTLRSGGKVQYNGNIVLIGDVNPGAEVIATGNIIIMGALRGIAHAGATGNKHASVVAFSLQPTQLRISDLIARSPDQKGFKPSHPEKACINGDSIIILPYYKNI